MSTLDLILFVVAVVGVITFGIWKSNREEVDADSGASNYFLAGRGLTWWLVGFSLIAANISTEQFVGMSGKAADWLGMAIASYEWMAAITLVVVAFVFLPKLLRCGLYTIPEFLEYRFGVFSRTIMAIATMVILVGVPTASVIFSGAKVVSVFFQDTSVLGLDLGNITVGCWIIALSAAAYVFIGGLKACAWTDLIWGSALIVGGAAVMFLAFQKLGDMPAQDLMLTKVATSDATVDQIEQAGAIERFKLLNAGPVADGPNGSGGKLHMRRPATDPEIPWTALMLGLWIPNFFYWGLNQYIMQRTLGSKSLAEGQKGVVFAAALKLIIPFVVVIPGILAFNLFSGDLKKQADTKNAETIAKFESGSEQVFPMSQSFASLHPDLARRIISHNAKKTGATVELPPRSASEGEFFAANQSALSGASASTVDSASRLVGYDYDAAFGTLLRNLLKPGLTWFVLAAIFGAVVSSLASMLNSASTIATMDIVAKIGRKFNGNDLSQKALVASGRICVVLFVTIAAIIAPQLGRPEFGGIFTFIQEFQGFISPGVLAVFLFGFLVPKAPRYIGWLGIVSNAILYGFFKWFGGDLLVRSGLWFSPEVSFLDRMGICFLLVLGLCGLLTALNPLAEPVKMPVNDKIELVSSPLAKAGGIGVCLCTVILYAIFW
ncbi:MAG: sodium/solute symporter [Chthoniobacterales bacterium]